MRRERRQEVCTELDYEQMAPSQRQALCAWLEENLVDPRRVPVKTTLVRDDVHREWIVEYYPKPVRIGPDGEIPTKRVRRAIRSYLAPDSPVFARPGRAFRPQET